MARRKPDPAITHTETLCYAIYHLEQDVRNWENALSGRPDAKEALSNVCARQLRQLKSLKQMYYFETGEEYC